jgi:hypothetical protein
VEGEITAQGYTHRLLRVYDGETADVDEASANVEEWVRNAAILGHEAAYEDYKRHMESSGAIVDEVRSARLARRYPETKILQAYIADSQWLNATVSASSSSRPTTGLASESWLEPINEEGDTLLHWASQYGFVHQIRHLLESSLFHVNSVNHLRDTPLAAACKVGCLRSVECLLTYGADPNLANTLGEVPLHHLWMFSDSEANLVLGLLAKSGADFRKRAAPAFHEHSRSTMPYMSTELDPLPVLPGLPIERIAGRGRTKLVYGILKYGAEIVLGSGNTIRRMILWASRLHFVEIRQILVRYAKHGVEHQGIRLPLVNHALSHVENTQWEHENHSLTLMSAVSYGWTLPYGKGWNTPGKFWRLCAHGKNWRHALESTIVELVSSSGSALCVFEPSLAHAITFHQADFIASFLDIYLTSHAPGSFATTLQHTCVNHDDPQTLYSGFNYGNQTHG